MKKGGKFLLGAFAIVAFVTVAILLFYYFRLVLCTFIAFYFINKMFNTYIDYKEGLNDKKYRFAKRVLILPKKKSKKWKK